LRFDFGEDGLEQAEELGHGALSLTGGV